MARVISIKFHSKVPPHLEGHFLAFGPPPEGHSDLHDSASEMGLDEDDNIEGLSPSEQQQLRDFAKAADETFAQKVATTKDRS